MVNICDITPKIQTTPGYVPGSNHKHYSSTQTSPNRIKSRLSWHSTEHIESPYQHTNSEAMSNERFLSIVKDMKCEKVKNESKTF